MDSLDSTVVGVLAATSAILATLALAVAVAAWRLAGRHRRGARRSPLPHDVEGLRAEVHRLREDSTRALSRLAVVRYDAFGDMGGRLSWSLALLDADGDGMVLTSIHGRSDSRSYAKDVVGWSSSQTLSPEEAEALARARSPLSLAHAS